MSKAFIASVLQESLDCTGVAANQAADDLIQAIVKDMKKEVVSQFELWLTNQAGRL